MVSKEDMPFFCSPCFIVCNSKKSFDQHCNGKAHIKKCEQTHSTSCVVETTKRVPEYLSCSVCNLKYQNLDSFIKHCYSIDHAENILKKAKVQNCEREISQSSHCTSEEGKKAAFLCYDQTDEMLTSGDISSIGDIEKSETKLIPSLGMDESQEEYVVHESCNSSMNVHDTDLNKDVHFCTVCNVPVMGLKNYKEHLKGSKHQKQETKQSQKTSSNVGKGNVDPVYQRNPPFHVDISQVNQRHLYFHNDRTQMIHRHPNFQINDKPLRYQNSLHYVNGRQARTSANQAKCNDHACFPSEKPPDFVAPKDLGSEVPPKEEFTTALSTTQTNCECYSIHMGVNQFDPMKSPTEMSRSQMINKHHPCCLGMGIRQPNLRHPSCQMNGISFFCSICSILCNSKKSLDQHCKGKAHKKKSEEIHGINSITDASNGMATEP